MFPPDEVAVGVRLVEGQERDGPTVGAAPLHPRQCEAVTAHRDRHDRQLVEADLEPGAYAVTNSSGPFATGADSPMRSSARTKSRRTARGAGRSGGRWRARRTVPSVASPCSPRAGSPSATPSSCRRAIAVEVVLVEVLGPTDPVVGVDLEHDAGDPGVVAALGGDVMPLGDREQRVALDDEEPVDRDPVGRGNVGPGPAAASKYSRSPSP